MATDVQSRRVSAVVGALVADAAGNSAFVTFIFCFALTSLTQLFFIYRTEYRKIIVDFVFHEGCKVCKALHVNGIICGVTVTALQVSVLNMTTLLNLRHGKWTTLCLEKKI